MKDVYDSDLSPKSMAEAAYTAAVAQIAARHDQKNRNLEEETDVSNRGIDDDASDRGHITNIMKDGCGSNDVFGDTDLCTCFKGIWKSSDYNIEEKLSETLRLLVGELDSLLEYGLGAFNELDTTTRYLTQAKEHAAVKSREAKRLQLIDEQSRTSLSVNENVSGSNVKFLNCFDFSSFFFRFTNRIYFERWNHPRWRHETALTRHKSKQDYAKTSAPFVKRGTMPSTNYRTANGINRSSRRSYASQS